MDEIRAMAFNCRTDHRGVGAMNYSERALAHLECDGEVERFAVSLDDIICEHEQVLEQARYWHTAWAYTFGLLLICVATIVWGGAYIYLNK